jgi:hypothetical protein
MDNDWFDIDNQKKIVDLLDNLDKKIDLVSQEVDEFDELRGDVTEIKVTQQELFNKLEKIRVTMANNASINTKILEKLDKLESLNENYQKVLLKLESIEETQKDIIKDIKKENELPSAIFPFLDTNSFTSERSKNMMLRKHTPFKFLPQTVEEKEKKK